MEAADVAAKLPTLRAITERAKLAAHQPSRAIAGEEAGQGEHAMVVAARREAQHRPRSEGRSELVQPAAFAKQQ
ncbi:MAG: hypothetical protein KGM15_06500 [Pseudomonadota bacterium]|nr:hypothetical protein [Pseudomonadota bacterium]